MSLCFIFKNSSRLIKHREWRMLARLWYISFAIIISILPALAFNSLFFLIYVFGCFGEMVVKFVSKIYEPAFNWYDDKYNDLNKEFRKKYNLDDK